MRVQLNTPLGVGPLVNITTTTTTTISIYIKYIPVKLGGRAADLRVPRNRRILPLSDISRG